MLSYLFIFLAAAFNAVMDTLDYRFDRSIFKNLNPKWWEPRQAYWNNPKFLGIVTLDAWHLAKYGMMGSMVLMVISTYYYGIPLGLWNLFILPFIWFLGFEIIFKLLSK